MAGRSTLLHPVPLLAMVALVVNDHWAKAAFDNFVTGKVSDVAGMIFFPLLLVAMVELLRPRVDRRVLVGAIVATGVVFALVKTWPPMTALYCWGLGFLQAPVRGAVVPVSVQADVTDLWALPALWVPWWVGRRRG